MQKVQRHLQLRIEAQGKYLQSVLEKAQETLGGAQSMGTVGLEAAKVELSDLASQVSTQCLNSAFPHLSDLRLQPKPAADGSIDSCVTSSYEGGGSIRDHEQLYSSLVGLKPAAAGFRQPRESKENDDDDEESRQRLQQITELRWRENSYNLSIGIGAEGDKWSGGGEAEGNFFGEGDEFFKNKTTSSEMKLPFLSTKLDLNADDAASGCKQLDLNGFGWN